MGGGPCCLLLDFHENCLRTVTVITILGIVGLALCGVAYKKL